MVVSVGSVNKDIKKVQRGCLSKSQGREQENMQSCSSNEKIKKEETRERQRKEKGKERKRNVNFVLKDHMTIP